MAWSRLASALTTVAACCAATGCGTGNDADQVATLVIDARDPQADVVELRAPETVPAGAVAIELRNLGDTTHDAQLFRVEGNRSEDDVAALLEQPDGSGLPDWLRLAGGVSPIRPGQSARVRQVLEPGTYVVADTQERPDPTANVTGAAKGGVATFQVTGDGGSELPPTSARIVARESGYRATGIRAGSNRLTFENAGREPHQVVILPLARGQSMEAGEPKPRGFEFDIGWVPVPFPADRATTVLEPGDALVTEFDLAPGRHVLLCFMAPRGGGPAQWARGMTSELEVPAAQKIKPRS